MNVGFEIIIQWLQSMKRKTCKLSINKLCCCKVCDDHCCVHEAISIECPNSSDPWLRQFSFTILSDWARKRAPNVVLQLNKRDMWELLDEPGWLCFTWWLSSRFKISLAGQDWRDLDASVKGTNQRNNGYDIRYNNNFSIARQQA